MLLHPRSPASSPYELRSRLRSVVVLLLRTEHYCFMRCFSIRAKQKIALRCLCCSSEPSELEPRAEPENFHAPGCSSEEADLRRLRHAIEPSHAKFVGPVWAYGRTRPNQRSSNERRQLRNDGITRKGSPHCCVFDKVASFHPICNMGLVTLIATAFTEPENACM